MGHLHQGAHASENWHERGLFEQFDIRTEDMPSEMCTLLADYPREQWSDHAGFKGKTRQWLGAHQGFRRLSAAVREDTESYLDAQWSGYDFASRLSYRGSIIVGNLHGHHRWEDRSYFPELSAADSRFDKGLVILEKDHVALNAVLDSFTNSANRSIKLIDLDETQAKDEAGKLHSAALAIIDYEDKSLS